MSLRSRYIQHTLMILPTTIATTLRDSSPHAKDRIIHLAMSAQESDSLVLTTADTVQLLSSSFQPCLVRVAVAAVR